MEGKNRMDRVAGEQEGELLLVEKQHDEMRKVTRHDEGSLLEVETKFVAVRCECAGN